MSDKSLVERVEALEAGALSAGEEVRQEFVQTRRLIDERIGETNRQLLALKDEMGREMRELNEETRREMRVLHEDVVDRIKMLGEQRNGGAPRPTPRRRR